MIMPRKYKIEDWSAIDDAVEPFCCLMPTQDFLEITKRGIAITGIEDGNVMTCGGIVYVNDNEGIVWVKVSKKCLRQSYRWARSIREAFELMMDSVGDLRISTYVLDNFCRGDRLAKFIGMKRTNETEEYKSKTYNKYAVVI